VFLATLYVEAEEYDRADDELERALAVDPRSLEALSVRAAIHLLRGERAAYDSVRRSVLTLNPAYADFYTTMAEVSQRNRLYREAAEFGRGETRERPLELPDCGARRTDDHGISHGVDRTFVV